MRLQNVPNGLLRGTAPGSNPGPRGSPRSDLRQQRSALTDAAFVSFVELGRRGTGHLVTAKRVEPKRSAEATGFHEAYFKGPITFAARLPGLAR